MHEPMSYVHDSMWYTICTYPNKVWNVRMTRNISLPLLCGITTTDYHIEPNNIRMQIEKLAGTQSLAIHGLTQTVE